MMNLEIDKMNPRVLRASRFNYFFNNMEKFTLIPRTCYNYEVEFMTESSGGIIINGEYIEFKAGEINIRKPGEVVCGIPPYQGYIVCFSPDPP